MALKKWKPIREFLKTQQSDFSAQHLREINGAEFCAAQQRENTILQPDQHPAELTRTHRQNHARNMVDCEPWYSNLWAADRLKHSPGVFSTRCGSNRPGRRRFEIFQRTPYLKTTTYSTPANLHPLCPTVLGTPYFGAGVRIREMLR